MKRALLLAALTACGVPDTEFAPSLDGAPGSNDGGPDQIHLVFDHDTVELTEGMPAVDLSVTLSAMPAETVDIDLTGGDAAKLNVSPQHLVFQPAQFADAQVVTFSPLPDDDTAPESLDVTFHVTAGGLPDRTMHVAITDPDTVQIVADIDPGTPVNVTEGTTKVVHAHLSKKPSGNLQLAAALNPAMPMTIDPPVIAFAADDNYGADVAFTITAPHDVDADMQTQVLTLSLGTGNDSKQYTVQDVDIDTLSITADTTSYTMTEGTTKVVTLRLSQQPTVDTTVTLSAAGANHEVTINGGATGTVTFSHLGNDYMAPHDITILAAQDADTNNEDVTLTLSSAPTALVGPTINVHISDDDVQNIQVAPDTLEIDENGTGTFGVRLAFDPITTVQVSVQSAAPGVATVQAGSVLAFTSADYDQPSMHQVTVRGTDDNNLTNDSAQINLSSGSMVSHVAVTVDDDDHQQLVVTPLNNPALIDEGTTYTFNVSLRYLPTGATHVTVGGTTPALPLSTLGLDFLTTTYSTPQPVTIAPPVDTNATAESTLVTLDGPAGSGIAQVAFTARVTDTTQLLTQGWKSHFGTTSNVNVDTVVAYKVHIPTSTFDSFGIYVPTAAGDFRMALYADDGAGHPGARVDASLFNRRTLANGDNVVDLPDFAITNGDYWIALRVDQVTAIGTGDATQTGAKCVRNTPVVGLDTLWPAQFASSPAAMSCGTVPLINIWTNTYTQ